MQFIPLLIIAGLIIGLLGKNKKFGFWGYFLASIFLTPVIGLLLVLASDKKIGDLGPNQNQARYF